MHFYYYDIPFNAIISWDVKAAFVSKSTAISYSCIKEQLFTPANSTESITKKWHLTADTNIALNWLRAEFSFIDCILPTAHGAN